jgi:Xaa-Pro aminopeptidase
MTLQPIVTTEFDVKQARINALLTKHKLDGLLLQKVSSFAWATCGANSYVNTANGQGEASLLILPSGKYLITNNIEASRLEQEENLYEQNWEFCVVPWYEVQDVIGKLAHGLSLGADGAYKGATNLSLEMSHLRAALTTEEGRRFKTLGNLCAEAMNSAVRSVRPGQSEYQIAASLAQETESRGVQAIVNLIATDVRISNFRHPLPTPKKLEKYAMLILCGRQRGLICSITRLIHFGRIPDDIRRKAQSVAEIDTILINATRPDRSLSEIFDKAVKAYGQAGHPDEWTRHHQGGLAGYEPREVTATPTSKEVVSVGQTYAWNPTIPGTKSEDTILVGKEANEILTAISDWPMVTINIDNHPLERPMILEMA